MNTIWKENGGIPASLLWKLAVVSGLSVANLYYNQPLLGQISRDLHISDLAASHIAMFTQIGYALGLFFIIPLGDLCDRRRILIINFSCLVLSLLTIGLVYNIYLIYAASLVTGICSITPQLFIPIAAQYSTPETKGRNVGLIVSGLLIGILASRVVSGFAGELWGWRFMFYGAAFFMVISAGIVLKALPEIPRNFRGNYFTLLKSIFGLIRRYSTLRVSSLRGGCAFGAFMAMWSCLAFKMEQPPFFAGSYIVGLLGLCGIAGALTASFVGRLVNKVGVKRFNWIGYLMLLAAWTFLFGLSDSYVGILIGIFLIDIGMQCIQLSNQTTIFSLCPSAANRINTVFMTTYFMGGSMGVFLAGIGWSLFEWNGVVLTAVILTGIGCLINHLAKD